MRGDQLMVVGGTGPGGKRIVSGPLSANDCRLRPGRIRRLRPGESRKGRRRDRPHFPFRPESSMNGAFCVISSNQLHPAIAPSSGKTMERKMQKLQLASAVFGASAFVVVLLSGAAQATDTPLCHDVFWCSKNINNQCVAQEWKVICTTVSQPGVAGQTEGGVRVMSPQSSPTFAPSMLAGRHPLIGGASKEPSLELGRSTRTGNALWISPAWISDAMHRAPPGRGPDWLDLSGCRTVDMRGRRKAAQLSR